MILEVAVKKITIFILLFITIAYINKNVFSLTVVSDGFSPMYIDDTEAKKNNKPSYAIELLQNIYEKYGTDLIFEKYNWARASREIRKAKLDIAIAGAFKTNCISSPESGIQSFI